MCPIHTVTGVAELPRLAAVACLIRAIWKTKVRTEKQNGEATYFNNVHFVQVQIFGQSNPHECNYSDVTSVTFASRCMH